jgi:hypothetical protein
MATIVECAAHCCVSATRLRDLVGGGQITRCEPGHYDFDKVRAQYIKYLQEAAAGRGDGVGGQTLSKQRARLAQAQADRAEARNRIEGGEYISVKAITKVMTGMFGVIRELALSTAGKITDEVASLNGDREATLHVIDYEMRAMLELLSEPELMKEAIHTQRARRDGRSQFEPAE